MEPMTIREIMDAVGGKLLGEFGDINRMVGRVETDSRTIHAGSLFVPLVGERFDGHAYINAALEGGAGGCLTARTRDSYLPGKFYVKVEDTQKAIRCGIRKINYFSYMSNAGVKAVKELLEEKDVKYFHELANAATLAMEKDVLQAMAMFALD